MKDLLAQLRDLCTLRVRGWVSIAAAVAELERLAARVEALEGESKRSRRA